MSCNQSEAYKQGQQAGRLASNIVVATEQVAGTAAAATGAAALADTAVGGAACAALTAGGCAPVAGAALVGEAVVAVGGTVVAGIGMAQAAYIRGNPLSGGLFQDNDINVSGHFYDELKNKGVSEQQAFKTYNTGKKYTASDGAFIRWDPKTGVVVYIKDGQVITIGTDQWHPSSKWVPGWVEDYDSWKFTGR